MKYAIDWVRFIFCHWVAFDDNQYRQTQAQFLSLHAYDFLNNQSSTERRHLVLLGDFNDEPHGLIEKYLFAHKHRARSKDVHHTDADVQRIHLYNCSWRFSGEKRAHGTPLNGHFVDGAGTYYWRKKKSWHTFDQLIVNASLLTDDVPYLDEAKVEAIHLAEAMDPDGLPAKFEVTTKGPIGVSDHVPFVGQIVLRKGEQNESL